MGADAPTIVFIPVHHAPKKAPCPKCGKLGKRKRTCTRAVRTVAFKAVAYLKITYGEYTARCQCCTTFRNTPEGVLPKAHYDNKVRDLVLDRIIKDGMSTERILESLRRKSRTAKAAARRGMTVKEKAYFVFKHRYLIVKRLEDFTEQEHDDLRRMLEYLPELATLRRFADRMYWLFDTPKDFHQANCRRAAIVRDPAFQTVPELVKAMEQLDEEKFPKPMAYLNNPISRRVRTNNHVERTNRMFRFLEKVRYKWRRRKTLVRFVILTLDDVWSDWEPPMVRGADRPKPVKHGKTQPQARQAQRQVA